MNKGESGYPPSSSEETDSPLILTPASSQGTNNELVTACSMAGSSNQTHFTHPMCNTANYQHPKNAAGFACAMTNNMEANPHSQAAYFQNLAHTADQNYLNMSNGELPFGSHIGQTLNNSATNNATSFSDRLREPYAWRESEEDEILPCSTCDGGRPQNKRESEEEEILPCSIACDGGGSQNEREMDFRDSHQRARYIEGMGLPNDGATAEERLLRAINMDHYILIGHINSLERKMKEYVHTNVNQIVDHSAHTLFKKMHLMQQKVDSLSKDSVNESIPPQPSFIPPSSTRVSPILFEAGEKEDHPLAHLELAILKLWAHIDKLKEENRLRSEGETERKELEELIASELLYHNHLMERMQAKISSMTKEVTCCWTEIKKLQNAVKELESGGSVKKAPVVRTNSGVTNTGVAATPWMPVSEELRNGTRKYSDKKINTPEEELECACDLCAKARAGKSAGVTTEDKADKPTAAPQAVASVRLNKLKGTDRGGENVTSLDQVSASSSGRLKRRCTVEKCLAALNLKPIARTIVTHFVSSSAVADKWRDIYSRSKQENQSIVEMKISNGDVIILLVEPSPDSENIAMIIGQGVADSLVDLVTIGLIDFQVEVTEGVSSNVTFVGVTSTIPARSEDQRCSTTEWGKIRFPGTFDPTRERSNLSSHPFLSQFGSRQADKSQPCSSSYTPFAPLPKVARDATSITRHLHKPKFGTYGFPWVESLEKLSLSNSSPENSTQIATPASSTYWFDEFPEKQQKNTKDQQSSYCDRLRESRFGKEQRREQISTGKIGTEKENGRGSGFRSRESKGEYETENESIREKESDDSVLAAINAALTKMSKMSEGEIGEKTVNVDGVVPGSSTRMDGQKHERREQNRQMKKRYPTTALSMVAEADFLSDSD